MLPLEEHFRYDANLNIRVHNRIPRGVMSGAEQFIQQQEAGRVIRRGACEYRYDDAGRLVEKRLQKDGWRPQTWRYRWNAQSQLSEFITPDGERWCYAYDPFGRRIRKQKRMEGLARTTKPVGCEYQWSGDQMIAETPLYADGRPAYEDSIHWLYAPDALTPVARWQHGQLHYVVSDHMGTPRELLTEQGKVVWAGRLSTWGQSWQWPLAANDADKLSCNLRFAGQYEDEESGLHYNRFRYYDTETGQYLSPDPIGLLGGVNPYGYVHNPLSWVDPLGLACCPGKKTSYEGLSRSDAFRQAKRDAEIPMGQNPKSITRPNLLDGSGNKILNSNGQPITTRQYEFTNGKGDAVFIQEHSLGHAKATSGHGAEPHFNVRPPENLNTGSVFGTHGHYNF